MEGSAARAPIAIVGIACLFPQARDVSSYWANIKGGVDAITAIPPSHWRPEEYLDPDPSCPDRVYVARGGFLPEVGFPALEYGIPPNALEATDTSQLLGLLVAEEALRDAGYGREGRAFDRSRVSVLLGVTGTLELVIPLGARLGHPIWRQALREAGVEGEIAEQVVRRIGEGYVEWQEDSFPGLLGNVVAGRIANRLDLGGTNSVVDAACASSLGALHLAEMELASGRADMVLSGGVDSFNDIFMYMCFSKTPALSPGGDARPFDRGGDGTILGEGIGILILKRVADARRDGDRIYALVSGIGTSSDGRGTAIYAPSAAGQARALRGAYERAGVAPDSVELLEAHGTGTAVGDAVELSALTEVYREARADGTWCALGSVKSQIGHTKAAAGVAGLIKAALALHHKVLPPTIKVEDPLDPLASGDTPFYLNTSSRPWLSRAAHPRRAAVSSFGFGGSNFHCVLEEAEPRKGAPDWDGRVQILAFSAAERGSLEEKVEAARTAIAGMNAWVETRVAAARARAAFRPEDPERLLVVVDRQRGLESAAGALAEALSLLGADPERQRWMSPGGIFYGRGPAPGKLGLLFPGQGAQYPGMLRDLACLFPRFLEILEEADRAFWEGEEARGSARLSDMILPPRAFTEERRGADERALRSTRVAQPAIGAVSLGALRLLEAFGVVPEACAGHSYGELVALCAAGRLSERALHALSNFRGRLMGAGSGDRGGMLAVEAPIDELAGLLEEEGLDLVLANHNAPRQGVLSGASDEIARATGILTGRGFRVRRLEVAAAFHSPLVADAERPFEKALRRVRIEVGQVPVYANSTALRYADDPGEARRLLAGQLARPVRFAGEIETMLAEGVRTFLEIGPGSRLTGLVGAITEARGVSSFALDASSGRACGIRDLALALSHLASLGHPVDLGPWDGGGDGEDLVARRPATAGATTRPAGPALLIPICGANLKPGMGPRGRAESPGEAPEAATGGHGGRKAAVERGEEQGITMEKPATNAPEEGWVRSPGAEPEPGRDRSPERGEPDARGIPDTPTPEAPVDPPPIAAPGVRIGDAPPPPDAASQPSVPPPQSAGGETGADPAGALSRIRDGIAALERLNEQTARLHQQFLEAQRGAQESLRALIEREQRTLLGGAPAIEAVRPGTPLPSPLPATTAAPPDRPPRVAPPPPAVAVPDSPPSIDAAAAEARPPRPAAEGPLPPAGTTPAAAPAGNRRAQVEEALLETVSEKTGYPPEILQLDMDLEADLGIDSIKRVEILSAMKERLPGTADVKPEELGTLGTLGSIVDRLSASAAPGEAGGAAPGAQPSPGRAPEETEAPVLPSAGAPGAMEPDASPTVAAPDTRRELVEAVLLETVAQKTGYPPEILQLDMDLEADLGIDSIKRVEILSAMRDRLPEIPEVKPEELGTLGTLAAIATRLAGPGPAAEHHAEHPAGPPPRAGGSPPATEILRTDLRAVPLGADRPTGSPGLGAGSNVWILEDGSGLAPLLVEELRARRMTVRRIAAATLEGLEPPESLGALILLAPPRGEGRASLLDAFRLLRLTGPALRRGGPAGGALVATVSRLDGAFGLHDLGPSHDPTGGGFSGIAKTVGREWPEVRGRALDLALELGSGEASARALADELLRAGPAEVGISAEGAFALEETAARDGDGALGPPFEPGEAVLLTGGARGVTAECAVALAQAYRPTLILFGRSAPPGAAPEPEWLAGLEGDAAIREAILARAEGRLAPREIEAECRAHIARREIAGNIARMEEAGSRVLYRQVDVRERSAVHRAIEEARAEVGPIRGLLHGAGVIADREILRKTEEQFERVVSTKVDSLLHLLDALRDEDLRTIALFSSSTARYGRTGQIDYAVANEILNKLAQREARRRPGTRVVSINWGPWAGGMVTAELAAIFEREGIGLIPTARGAEVLLEEIARDPHAPVEVVVLAGGPSATGSDPEPGEPEALKSRGAVKASEAAAGTGIVAQKHAAAEPGAALRPALEIELTLARFPFLASHVMDGRAVLPMAMMLEWFAHAALHENPGLVFHGVDDLRVLKGVILDREGVRRLRFLAGRAEREGATYRVPLELKGPARSGEEVLHARGTVVLAAGLPPAPAAAAGPALEAYPQGRAEIYGGMLFHGRALEAIEGVDGCSEEGITGLLRTAPPPDRWIERPLRSTWLTDPLVIDGSFQLLILWSLRERGAGSLPCRVRSYRQYRGDFGGDRVTVSARVTDSSEHGARAEIDLLDPAGTVIARLEGYECVIDASLGQAFRANRITEDARR